MFTTAAQPQKGLVMHANSSTRARDAHTPEAPNTTGVPPVPPEDSPKAAPAESRNHLRAGAGRMDVRQVVTDRIVAMLEKGGNVFRERWTRAASRGMPRNGKTGASYRGANVLLLWDAAIEQGFASNIWMTYKQADSLGAQVRKGERAVMCAHFERKVRKGGAADDDSGTPGTDAEAGGEKDATDRDILMCRPFWLFNVAQIDGLPSPVLDLCCEPARAPIGPVERAFRVLAGCNATIRHGFGRAAYFPELDEIRLPWPSQFTGPEACCATTLHELVHWTGHAMRLNRQFGRRFGDDAYAFEELVAELGCAFVMGHCGLVEATIEGHAAYLDSWLKVLKDDRTAIFTAARHACEAFDFILARDLAPLTSELRGRSE